MKHIETAVAKRLEVALSLEAMRKTWRASVLKVYPEAKFSVVQDRSKDTTAYIDLGSKDIPTQHRLIDKGLWFVAVGHWSGYSEIGTVKKKSDVQAKCKEVNAKRKSAGLPVGNKPGSKGLDLQKTKELIKKEKQKIKDQISKITEQKKKLKVSLKTAKPAARDALEDKMEALDLKISDLQDSLEYVAEEHLDTLR